MSRSVRIRGDVAARVEVWAVASRRPFANAVEVLVLAGLEGRAGNSPERSGVEDAGSTPVTASARPSSSERLAASGGLVLPEPGGKPTSPADVAATVPGVTVGAPSGKCGYDTPRGTRCKLCGKVH